MNVKEYLSRYHETKVKIEKLEQIVAEYIRLADSIPGISFDAIRVDGTKSLEAPFEKWIHRALNDEAEIKVLKKALPIIKGEIISVIDTIEDEQHKMIMIHRYIDWLSWSEISKKLYYSPSKIRRVHDKTLEELEICTKGKDEQG